MKKILKIFEQEEEKELTDYEKILALNKRKIDPYDTDFDGCDGEDYSDSLRERERHEHGSVQLGKP